MLLDAFNDAMIIGASARRNVVLARSALASLTRANRKTINIGLQEYDAIGLVCRPTGGGSWARFEGNENAADGIGSSEHILETITQIGSSRYHPMNTSRFPFGSPSVPVCT